MKILLLGREGQVGWELQRALSPLGELVALCSQSERNPQSLCGDLRDLDGLAGTVRQVAPDLIVNAAAYTAVDRAEAEPEQALRINALAPQVLANEASRLQCWLLHYSTDYVFDGSGARAWVESDTCAPLNVYGHSKWQGEQAVASTVRHLILRTSWVYGARGGNFAKTMLRLAAERDSLNVINDQIGAPTSAELLADVAAHAIRSAMQTPALAGLYHCAATGETSWYGYARYVLAQAQARGVTLKAGPQQLTAIPSSSYPTAARRPLNSRLNSSHLTQAFGLRLPEWQTGVARMLDEISGKP